MQAEQRHFFPAAMEATEDRKEEKKKKTVKLDAACQKHSGVLEAAPRCHSLLTRVAFLRARRHAATSQYRPSKQPVEQSCCQTLRGRWGEVWGRGLGAVGVAQSSRPGKAAMLTRGSLAVYREPLGGSTAASLYSAATRGAGSPERETTVDLQRTWRSTEVVQVD